ncbi:MAG: hypothetical protein AB1791_17415, partial [Chloroflexota bacterium]
MSKLLRPPLLFLSFLSLLAALWAGLVRLGWALPPVARPPILAHGPLMISGFLGTLITLERVVALVQRLPQARPFYLAPLLSGVGGLALLLGAPVRIGQITITLASLGLVAVFVLILRLITTPSATPKSKIQNPSFPYVVMSAAAALWLLGNGLWLIGRPLAWVVPWWAGFLILTIAGERLELAKVLLRGGQAGQLFLGVVGLFLAGLFLSLAAVDLGLRLAGVGLVGLGLWLLRYDVARRTIRQTGLTRFIAACLLPGYLWLIVGGGLWLWLGAGYTAGPLYDAMLHTLFLGFVFSMIFGHAPLILPAILPVTIPYRPLFYL